MFRTLSKLRNLVTAFESGRVLPRDWNHRTRLVLGLWYVLNPTKDGPIEAMHRGIMACESRLHSVQPRSGVNHEAITAFYVERIKAFAIAALPDLGLVELVNALLTSELADPRLHFCLFHAGGPRSEAISITPPRTRLPRFATRRTSVSVTSLRRRNVRSRTRGIVA